MGAKAYDKIYQYYYEVRNNVSARNCFTKTAEGLVG